VRAALLVATILCSIAPARASDLPRLNVGPPLQLRLEGNFAPDREHAVAGGADAVHMTIGGHDRWFAAWVARTVGGDQPRSGRDVLNALAPYQTSLRVVGSADLVRRIDDAPDGAPMSVEGLVDIESRSYLLRSVVIGSSPPS
jgi:hypothetical protein